MNKSTLRLLAMVVSAIVIVFLLYRFAVPEPPAVVQVAAVDAAPVAVLDTLLIEPKDGNGTHRDFIIPARAPAEQVRARLLAFYREYQTTFTWAQVDLYTSFEAWDEHRNGMSGFRPMVAAIDTGYVAQITFSPQQGGAVITWFAAYQDLPVESY